MIGYRGVRTTLASSGNFHPLNRPQGQWLKDGKVEVAWFAGHQMTLYPETTGGYRIAYLEVADPETYWSVQEAKDAAVTFARAVLLEMLADIGVGEEDVELKAVLHLYGMSDWSKLPK